MEDNKPLLSICLPTNGAVQFVTKALDSIYRQDEADKSKYEVFITDNGEDSKLEEALEPYKKYGNLRYLKTTDKGFMNLITCLKLGNGLFCKMLNHRSVLVPGSVQAWIDMVEQYKNKQPVIYCSDNLVQGDEIIECSCFQAFLRKLSFYTSWSAGIGVWDKDKQILDKIECNEMFPNASLLFEMRQDGEYVIWNKKYQNMEDDPHKGGYNYFQTFAVTYLDIIYDLRKRDRIDSLTFESVKKDLLVEMSRWYCKLFLVKNELTFEVTDFKKAIFVHYNIFDYLYMVLRAYFVRIKMFYIN